MSGLRAVHLSVCDGAASGQRVGHAVSVHESLSFVLMTVDIAQVWPPVHIFPHLKLALPLNEPCRSLKPTTGPAARRFEGATVSKSATASAKFVIKRVPLT